MYRLDFAECPVARIAPRRQYVTGLERERGSTIENRRGTLGFTWFITLESPAAHSKIDRLDEIAWRSVENELILDIICHMDYLYEW